MTIENDAASPAALALVKPQARAFDLDRVRLLDGPFRDARALDEAYLLALDPDRFLSRFRSEAGLNPKAPPYGGWESEGVAGQTLGHYLSALSMMHAATGDERFREKSAYVVSELITCQTAHGDGYVAAIPEGKRVFAEVRHGKIEAQGFSLNGA